MASPNILRVNSVEERDSYLAAVSEVIGNIIAEHKLTLVQIADAIDVSLSTISNAFNRKAGLSHPYLSRIGRVYGVQTLDPVARLAGGRYVPIQADPALDALPSTTAAIHRLAVARSPSSPGGETITHTELLGMEREIDDAIKALCALKARCEAVRAA